MIYSPLWFIFNSIDENIRMNTFIKKHIKEFSADAERFILSHRTFRQKRENFLSPVVKRDQRCAKISSFFGKCALTLINSIPPSDFSTRDEEKQYPFSENPTGKKRGFLRKNSLGLPENCFYLLKQIIRREINQNFCIRREIRRKIKKLFTIVGKTIFRLYFPPFLWNIVHEIGN